jgi:hypothetical protein
MKEEPRLGPLIFARRCAPFARQHLASPSAKPAGARYAGSCSLVGQYKKRRQATLNGLGLAQCQGPQVAFLGTDPAAGR